MKQEYLKGYILGKNTCKYTGKILSNLIQDYNEEKEDPVLLLATDYFNENKGQITRKFILKNMRDEYGGITEEDEHLYEVVKQKEGYCYKYYLDIDCKDVLKKDVGRYDKMLEKLLKNTRKIMKDKFNYEYGDEIILDASREIKGKYKYSKHIIFPIFLEKAYEIHKLYTFLNNYYKGEQYGIPQDILNGIDDIPYIRTENASIQFRLINNSKMGDEKSVLKGLYDYSIKDTLITQFNKDGKNILNEKYMEMIKEKNSKEPNQKKLGKDHIKEATIKDIDNCVQDTSIIPYSPLDAINLPIPKKYIPKSTKKKKDEEDEKDDYITGKMLLEYYKEYGYGLKQDIKIYLSVIPNKKEIIVYETWLKLAMICKKYGLDYIIFEEWTLQAYDTDEKIDAKLKCNKIWDGIDKSRVNLSIYLLIDTAKRFNPNIYLNMRFAYEFDNKYNIDKTGGGKWDKRVLKKDEDLDIARCYNEGYKTILCDAGVGYGKTTSVIKMINENIEDDIFVIAFSNRKIFATELSGKFKDSLNEDLVFNYDENRKDKSVSLEDKKVLVVSLESLYYYRERILKRIKIRTKLMLILDENETLLKNLTQDILEQKNNTAELLLDLWIKSSLNVLLDAYMTTNTINFVKEINRITNRENDRVIFLDTENNNKNPKTFRIKAVKMNNSKCSQTNEIVDKIVDEVVYVLNQGTKTSVVIDCEELGKIEAILNAVLKRYKLGEDEYLVNTGQSNNLKTEEQKAVALSYFKNTKLFDRIRLWIYNSSVMNGVSIEEKKFDKAIVLFSVYSISSKNTDGVGMYANDILNGLARARLNPDWDIYAIIYERVLGLFCKRIKFQSTSKIVKGKIEEIYNERMETNKLHIKAKMNDLYEYHSLSKKEFEEKQKRFDKLQFYLSLKDAVIERERDGNIEYIYNNEDLPKDYVAFSISKTEYLEFKNEDMLNVLAITRKLYECILTNNTKSSNLNAVWKQNTFIELATMKGNIVIDERDDFVGDGEPVNLRTLNIDCMTDTGILQVSVITNTIKKYYGEEWNGVDTLIACCKKPSVWKLIQRLIAVLNRTSITEAGGKYDPVYLLLVLKELDREFDDIPEALTNDMIKDNKLYDKTKSIFDSYKKANNIKVLKEVAEAYKASAFMRDFNNLLSPLQYNYKRKGGKNGSLYELQKPKIELTLILNGEEKSILLLPDDIEYMFQKRRKDILRGRATEKLKFIEDD